MNKKLFLLISVVLLLTGCSGGKKSLVIGVSQCSDDIWRTKLNDELSLAARVEGVTLRFSSADDDSQKQMAQIRRFVADGVDLLIISPNQSHTITPAVEEAFDAGIPVILFDRKIDSHKYTAFIGADNVEIGRIMGHYMADFLGKKGQVVEIPGLEGSSPADDRHKGFAEALAQYPGMTLTVAPYGGWLKEGGYDAMEEAFRRIVFNIAVDECDDHTKNFSFMLKEGGEWQLAPAYDLTGSKFPSDDPWSAHGGQHQLSVNGKRSKITDDDLLAVADRFAIGTAPRVLREVKSALA